MGLSVKQKTLWKNVDKILWEDWDPIGMRGSGPRDEYSSYVPSIFKLLIENRPADVIAEKLCQIESDEMGMKSNKEYNMPVAEKLITALTEFKASPD
jgi:hypothetical protein